MRSPKLVDPPRSAKRTVTVLRTAVSGAAGEKAGKAAGCPTGVPQRSQNARSGSSSASHFEQRLVNAEPHPPQNIAPGRFDLPHAPQSTAGSVPAVPSALPQGVNRKLYQLELAAALVESPANCTCSRYDMPAVLLPYTKTDAAPPESIGKHFRTRVLHTPPVNT